ncbi:hypothetical protein O6H91_18G012200 [Diphasiastrum complanatum]|uniref:Uncharacterized protein n=1 Tax=Diphasiastrum complanatum TaxID=34168 RepID=A0ACC2AY68_DIPCM|nr:hypothetical protein O6H91_18G012200 [Diphasiastrum complanatum]
MDSSVESIAVEQRNEGFVKSNGTHFQLDGYPFFLNGFNTYWLMYLAVDAGQRSKVIAVMQEAMDLGLTLARTWAFNDGCYRALQKAPGVYDEQIFQSLDFVIAEAKKYGLKLLLSLSNSFSDFGGKAQYVQWARSAGVSGLDSDDAFFTDSVIKGYYKAFVQTVLTRVNTVNGLAYRDDPTIFGWELMNEPRCPSDSSGDKLQGWIEEMAKYVKSIDNQHLLTVGLEGFYGSSTPEESAAANPNSYAGQVGTDFIRNHAIKEIDFSTAHIYPDNWLWQASIESQLSFTTNWIKTHAVDSQNQLNKPIIYAEFGKLEKQAGDRHKFFSAVYDGIHGSCSSGGAAAGGLLWQLFPDGMDGGMCDGFEVVASKSPSTASIIKAQSQRMSILNKKSKNSN